VLTTIETHVKNVAWTKDHLYSGGSWVPIEHKVASAEAYLHAKCHLSPASCLATADVGRKLGDCATFEDGKLGPHLTQSRLG